jgi:hypothetical protein
MGNLEYSFDNILKSYIDTGRQLTNHQVNLISSNKNMVKTYLRKRRHILEKGLLPLRKYRVWMSLRE